jgi:Transposase IS116/IS110/IS902 family
MTCPRQLRRVFASCLGADGERTMSSTPLRRRAWPRYAVTRTLSWPTISPRCSPCSTSAATTWSPPRTRLINQLHALLRDLLPGGAPTALTAVDASRLLTGVRPAGPVEAARKQLARDLVTEIRDTDQRLTTPTAQIADTLDAHGTRLRDVAGIGPVIAGRLLGRTRRAGRFRSTSAFASYAGVAPSRSPAATTRDTVCHAVVIGNSTSRCSSSRSPRYACVRAPVGPTTT